MTARELSDWVAFYEIEGFDLEADRRHAESMALQANVHRDAKKKPRPFAPDDFMPRKASGEEETMRERMLRKVKLYNQTRRLG